LRQTLRSPVQFGNVTTCNQSDSAERGVQKRDVR
jgi:hypothetical protein